MLLHYRGNSSTTAAASTSKVCLIQAVGGRNGVLVVVLVRWQTVTRYSKPSVHPHYLGRRENHQSRVDQIIP